MQTNTERRLIDDLARRRIGGDMPFLLPSDLWWRAASSVRPRMEARLAVAGLLETIYGEDESAERTRESIRLIEEMGGWRQGRGGA